jgi:biopolymer transport protein ExbD
MIFSAPRGTAHRIGSSDKPPGSLDVVRESHQADHFDLLPFIAILMCVLATELLVTMSMATISLGVGAAEGWIPAKDPNHPSKIPVLIEWDGETALVHRGRLRQTLRVPSPQLEDFLKEMAAHRDTDYALFAVRPAGFESYYRFAEEFRKRGIAVGFEPVEPGKSVRLASEGVGR